MKAIRVENGNYNQPLGLSLGLFLVRKMALQSKRYNLNLFAYSSNTEIMEKGEIEE